jgi:nitrous oxide reductase accessory protein NosL
MIRTTLYIVLLLLLWSAAVGAGGPAFAPPSAKDKCPVCGMFVSKYPDWIAAVTFSDGTSAYFDGPKDLFRFLSDVKRYAPNRRERDVTAIIVADYYRVTPLSGYAAFYVIGSDVFGPMGRELVPFAREADAREFMKDHGGDRILRFKDITSDVLEKLE